MLTWCCNFKLLESPPAVNAETPTDARASSLGTRPMRAGAALRHQCHAVVLSRASAIQLKCVQHNDLHIYDATEQSSGGRGITSQVTECQSLSQSTPDRPQSAPRVPLGYLKGKAVSTRAFERAHPSARVCNRGRTRWSVSASRREVPSPGPTAFRQAHLPREWHLGRPA